MCLRRKAFYPTSNKKMAFGISGSLNLHELCPKSNMPPMLKVIATDIGKKNPSLLIYTLMNQCIGVVMGCCICGIPAKSQQGFLAHTSGLSYLFLFGNLGVFGLSSMIHSFHFRFFCNLTKAHGICPFCVYLAM